VESGGGLLSRAVTHQVPSALKGLTSVFGMGTGDPLRHCHRKLWRSRESGAQDAFTLPGGLLLGHSPRSPAGLGQARSPCPRSSPDSHGGAVPFARIMSCDFPCMAIPPPSVLLRAGRLRLLSFSFRFLITSAPPLATTLTTAQLLTRYPGFLACSLNWSLLVIKPSAY
jgi:hypothetical protein